MQPKIELHLNTVQQLFMLSLKSGHNELVVSTKDWDRVTKDRDPQRMPRHEVVGDFVITERTEFNTLALYERDVAFIMQRLTREYGGFWFGDFEDRVAVKPIDLMDAGNRVPGSYYSTK